MGISAMVSCDNWPWECETEPLHIKVELDDMSKIGGHIHKNEWLWHDGLVFCKSCRGVAERKLRGDEGL